MCGGGGETMKTGTRTGPSTAALNLGSARRLVFIGLGLASMGVGAVGVFVPGLPTTIFLIAASYLFARSSPSLHRKLIEHPRLGPYLQNFEKDRSMPARAKAWTLLLMWAGITLSVVLAGGAVAFAAVLGSLGLIGTGVILFYVRTAVPRPQASERPAVNTCKQPRGSATPAGRSLARRFQRIVGPQASNRLGAGELARSPGPPAGIRPGPGRPPRVR